MTERSEFDNAFDVFLKARYPDHPKTERLREWNSRLLTLDSHIAGYAHRVQRGVMSAREIPDLEDLKSQVEQLQESINKMLRDHPEERGLMISYQEYAGKLGRLITRLVEMAR